MNKVQLRNCFHCGVPHVPAEIAERVRGGESIDIEIIYGSGVAGNVLKWRTGAINIDGCRIEASDGANRSRPPRTPNEILGGGKGTNLTASEHNDSGRWPANCITDGSDEVVGMFPSTAAAKTGKRNAPKTGGTFGDYAGDDAERLGHSDNGGSAARFYYSAKASKADRAGSKHPTVKPISLMQWLARLITPPGGMILDPFAGSGTTGVAAALEGFDCLLVEREAEYVADIVQRFVPSQKSAETV